MDQTSHFDSLIDTLVGTVNNSQQSLEAAEEKRKKDSEDNKRKIELLRQQQMLTDDLEVLILGLPIAYTESYEATTRMLSSALSLSPNKIPFFDYRTTSSPGPANSPQPTKAFITEMPTAKARNKLLSMGPKLKDLPSNAIWKMGDAHNVSIRPLYLTPSTNFKQLRLERVRS